MDPDVLVHKGDSKLKHGGPSFLSMFSHPKYEDAIELYEQAANAYKLKKEWPKAASCFDKCADCAEKLGNGADRAKYLKEGGDMLRKISTSQAVEKYDLAVKIYGNAGRFQMAAKLLLSVAELLEAERLQPKEVREYYRRAGEMFELTDHSASSISKCNLKVAEYLAKEGKLQEAVKIFESEGEKALANTLLQYGAKDHFFRAGILLLALGDSVSASIANEKYRALDPRFASSREGDLMQSLVSALEKNDVDALVDALAEYDAGTKLDPWKTEFLCKVKDSMTKGGGNAEDFFDLT